MIHESAPAVITEAGKVIAGGRMAIRPYFLNVNGVAVGSTINVGVGNRVGGIGDAPNQVRQRLSTS